MINVSAKGSSVSKGESLRDTALTVAAMGVDALVVRHHASGAAGTTCSLGADVTGADVPPALRAEAPPVSLEVTGGAAYELQMEEPYAPIPVQPFPDG